MSQSQENDEALENSELQGHTEHTEEENLEEGFIEETREEIEAREKAEAKEASRKKWAKIFSLACLVPLVLWSSKRIPYLFPSDVVIQYTYKGIAEPGQIKKVDSALYPLDAKKVYAQATYFHFDPLPNEGRDVKRRQKLKLVKGKYRVHVRLTYKNGSLRTFSQVLSVRDSGTFYIFLRKAKTSQK